MLFLFSVIFTSYAIGSLCASLLIGKFKGFDIRNLGSGSAGATNMWRQKKKAWALLVFVLDLLKAYLTLYVVQILTPQFSLPEPISPYCILLLSGIALITGHILPVFFQFRGGKGMAAYIGISFFLLPQMVLSLLPLSALLIILFRQVSLASIVAILAAFPISMLLVSESAMKCHALFYSLICYIVLMAHRGNLRRLLTNTESKIHW